MADHHLSSAQQHRSPSRSRQDSALRIDPSGLNPTPRVSRAPKVSTQSRQSSNITPYPPSQSRPSYQITSPSPSNRNTSPVKRVPTNANPPLRPSSRPTFSSGSRLTSPTKSSAFKQNSKITQNVEATPNRSPLWNTGKNANGLGLNFANPNHGRASPTRPSSLKLACSETDSIDSSLVNLTFVSAASGIDENQPIQSPGKSKTHQSSMLAGFGFTRTGNLKQSPILSTTPLLSPGKSKNAALKSDERPMARYDPRKEPIKAYLRIRPPNTPSIMRTPYITILNDTEVLLVPPVQASTSSFTAQETVNAKYKFTRVYGPEVTQQEFFQGTGLPLVSDLLSGKSSLCFAYGVTASGKTYTVQGGLDTVRGGGSMDPGLLPRTMDVLFNSIGDNLTELPIRPARLAGIEVAPITPELFKLLERDSLSDPSSPTRETPFLLRDPTALPVDQNAEYGIWISYAEVYNEKVYDLLDSILESSSSSSNTFQSFTANLAEQVKNAAQLLHTKASHSGGVIKRKPLALKHDKSSGNKYIHGLTEIRVRTAEEAKILLRHGQIHRTVFSTFANRTSSRSHGIFTIKLIKLPKNKPFGESLISMATASRLSIVDLAGSERTRNTQTTGQRLKEAGNINKSLMVLGQCMETLRKNQDLQERQKKLTIVPFRHSKLTELFQSFFTGGEGKTVMIVNVNPCDTGFEENSHVMKFSAVASEVVTIREEKNRDLSNFLRDQAEITSAPPPPAPDENSFILEDEEEEETNESGAEAEDLTDGNDAFVDHLLDQVSALRVKLVEAEIQAAMIEAEVREQVMQEYNQKMLNMEALFTRNMANEAKEAELKADRKIDIFNRATLRLNNAGSSSATQTDDSEGATDLKKTPETVSNAKGRSKRAHNNADRKTPSLSRGADNPKEPDDDDPTVHFHGRQLRSRSRRS